MLKSYGRWVVGDGGLQDFSVSPRPFGFAFETKGLGPGLDKKFILHSTTEINDNSELVHNSEVHKYIAHCTLDPGPAWPCVYSLEFQTVK